MKKILLLAFLLSANFIISQEGASLILNNDKDNYGGFGMSNGIWVKNNPTKTKIVGSNYLFKNWLNKAVVYDLNNKGYKLPNCNFNIKLNRFEAKLSDKSTDSIFSFDSRNINKFVLGSKNFLRKKIEGKGSNYFVELIVQDENISLYKGYSSKIEYAQVNPMNNQKMGNDAIVINNNYYVEKDGEIEIIKLKKSTILKLMADKKDLVKNFIKENKLSISEDTDLFKIFNYYNALK